MLFLMNLHKLNKGRSPNTLSSLAGSKDMHQQPLMAVSTSERDATYAAAPAYGINDS
jgi:hypothetical protein